MHECQCECRVVNNRGADGNAWSQLFPLPLCLIHLLTYNAKLLRQTCMCLFGVTSLLTHSFCLWQMHACSSHLLVYSCWIINFWVGWCDWNTQRHTQALAHARTDADLRLDQYPSLFCWRRHWHHSWPWAKYTLILQKKERAAERGREKRGTCKEKKRGAGSQLTGWPAARVFNILLPLLPELWASCGPLWWSSHLSFSSSSSHLSCTLPSCGCRGSWSHSEAW